MPETKNQKAKQNVVIIVAAVVAALLLVTMLSSCGRNKRRVGRASDTIRQELIAASIEFGYFQGQKDILDGIEASVGKQNGEWIWLSSPYSDGTPVVEANPFFNESPKKVVTSVVKANWKEWSK